MRELVDRVRDETAKRISPASTGAGGAARLRTAVRAWLGFMDGAILDWTEHGDVTRDELKGLLLGTLLGAVTASGHQDALARLAPGS